LITDQELGTSKEIRSDANIFDGTRGSVVVGEGGFFTAAVEEQPAVKTTRASRMTFHPPSRQRGVAGTPTFMSEHVPTPQAPPLDRPTTITRHRRAPATGIRGRTDEQLIALESRSPG
jgi:hypothetical protein